MSVASTNSKRYCSTTDKRGLVRATPQKMAGLYQFDKSQTMNLWHMKYAAKIGVTKPFDPENRFFFKKGKNKFEKFAGEVFN